MLKMASGKDRGRLAGIRFARLLAALGRPWWGGGRAQSVLASLQVTIVAARELSLQVPSAPSVVRATKLSWQALPPVHADGMPLPAGSDERGFICRGDGAGQAFF